MGKKTEEKIKENKHKVEIVGGQLISVLGYRAKRELQEGKPMGVTEAIRELIDKGLKA